MKIEELRKRSDQKFKMIATDPSGSGEILFAIPIPGSDLVYAEDESSAFIVDPIEDWIEAWEAYIETLPPLNRTKGRAAEGGAITDMPKMLAVPTLKNYHYSMTLANDGLAHLQTIEKALADSLQTNNEGVVRVQDGKAGEDGLEQWYDETPEALSAADIPLLLALYTVIGEDLVRSYPNKNAMLAAVEEPGYLTHGISIYLPDFMRMIGNNGNVSKDGQDNVVQKIRKLDALAGIITEEANGRVYRSVYPAMRFMGYDAKSNIFHFASPYCNILLATLLKKSVVKDKQGRPKKKNNGEPFTLPTDTRLIKPSIVTERNKKAVEIVCAVVILIEQCGNQYTAY